MFKAPLYNKLIHFKKKLYNFYQVPNPEAVYKKSVFSNIPFLARTDRLVKITYKGYSRPLSLKVEPTNICNNDCIICPYSLQTREHQTMSLELFEKILSDYKELGGGVLSIAVLVGDIFMDKYLPDRLELVKNNRSITQLLTTTNGVIADRYDQDTLKYIVQSFSRFRISIYGLDAEEHKTLTRRDDYDRAIESYIRLLNCSTGNVKFEIRLLKKRPETEVYKWLEDLKKRSNYSGPIRVGGIINEYFNWSVFDENSKLPFDAKWTPVKINTETCMTPLITPAVTATGDVSFCGCADYDLSKELLLGNINNTSLKDLYNSEQCRRLYNCEKYGVPGFCQKCTFHVPLSEFDKQPDYFSEEYFD